MRHFIYIRYKFYTMKYFYLIILLIFVSCANKNPTEKTLLIQPYQEFPKSQTDSLKKNIEDFYGLKTTVLGEIPLPKEAFTNYKAPRYRADSLIRFQKKILVNKAAYCIGLTNKDICITKYNEEGSVKKPVNKYTDFGIMGLAFCPGNSCVVSSFRLQHKNSKIFFNRLQKVTLHEIGHNLGLPHCLDVSCLMTDAVENIKTIDNAKLALCTNCKNKINL